MIMGLFTGYCVLIITGRTKHANIVTPVRASPIKDVFPSLLGHCCFVLEMSSTIVSQCFILLLILFLLPSDCAGGCELEEPTLDYWSQVEGMYNHQRKKENMISAVNNMNVETYQMFFKFCNCKYDVFIKNETICKYIFIRHFRHSLITKKQNQKKRMKMKQSPHSGMKIQAFEVSLITIQC